MTAKALETRRGALGWGLAFAVVMLSTLALGIRQHRHLESSGHPPNVKRVDSLENVHVPNLMERLNRVEARTERQDEELSRLQKILAGTN